MVELNNRELLADNVPKLVQVLPSVEYSHVPEPMVLVIAIPLSGMLSESLQLADVNKLLTKVLDEVFR